MGMISIELDSSDYVIVIFIVDYVIGITGAVAGGLAGILTILMAWKAKKLGNRKPEYSITKNRVLGIVLILIFLIGMGYEILRISGLV